jgi:deoxyribodipyrimidine photo-lyase
MDKKTPVIIFWFRRDLRLEDNAGLYRALKNGTSVLPIFIFDRDILDKLEDKDDARVSFIYKAIEDLDKELHKHNSSLLVLYDTAEHAFDKLLQEHNVAGVYTNYDYEPYAKKRDDAIAQKLKEHNIEFKSYKDQVIFDRDEVLKNDGKPYTVYTPYQRKWYETLKPFYIKAYPTEKYFDNLLKIKHTAIPTLNEMGFVKSEIDYPEKEYESVIKD